LWRLSRFTEVRILHELVWRKKAMELNTTSWFSLSRWQWRSREQEPLAGSSSVPACLHSNGATFGPNRERTMTMNSIAHDHSKLGLSVSVPWPPHCWAPLKHGFSVTGFDQDVAKANALIESRTWPADCRVGVRRGCCSVESSERRGVRSVYTRSDGVLEHIHPGSTIMK